MPSLQRISIITPSFNQGDYIEETICSVLDQGYQNLDYIIIDGGSTDKSKEIIKKYEKHLSHWESEIDSGQSHAISKGLSYATGDVINWLNSDDYLEPGSLKLISEIFEDPSVNAYCGVSRIFGFGTSRISSGTDVYFGNLEKTIALARIDQPETFFRRSTWLDIGGINHRYHYLMDKELWIRFLLRFGLAGVRRSKDIIANFRLHNASKTVSRQDGFDTEDSSLFYSLFTYLGEQKPLNYLKSMRNASFIPSNFSHGSARSKAITENFILGEIHKCYFDNNDALFDNLSNEINTEYLSDPDINLLERLRMRRRFVPAIYRPTLRKFISIFSRPRS